MNASFESVYRVSTRISVPTEEDINSLSRALRMELPMGYREYVASFGLGTTAFQPLPFRVLF